MTQGRIARFPRQVARVVDWMGSPLFVRRSARFRERGRGGFLGSRRRSSRSQEEG